jgi:hypothetical protein
MLDTLLEGDHPRIISANLVEIGRVVSEEKIFLKISSPLCFYFKLDGLLGWRSGSPDIFVKGGHPRAIPPKFGCNWLSGF